MKVNANFILNLDVNAFENVVLDGHFVEFATRDGIEYKVGDFVLMKEVNSSNALTGRKSLEAINRVIVDPLTKCTTLFFENLPTNTLTDRVSLAFSKKYLQTVFDMKVSLYNLRELAISHVDKRLIGSITHNLKEYVTVGEKKNYMMSKLLELQHETVDTVLYLYVDNVLDFNN